MNLRKKRICDEPYDDDDDDDDCCYDFVAAPTEFFTDQPRNVSRGLQYPCLFESVML
jgi:hypothetical protein